jgi:hypothetical protein
MVAHGIVTAYLQSVESIWKTGVAREHSYRPALADFLTKATGLTAVNEPMQVECGAPDFALLKQTMPIGHVEAKDLGINLDALAESEQINRYRAGLPNFILTNQLDFIWFVEGKERRRVNVGAKGKTQGILKIEQNQFLELEALLVEFAAETTAQITTAAELTRRLASVAVLIRESVKLRLRLKKGGSLHEQIEYFRKILSLNMTADQFADIYAQTITYGMFGARYYHKGTEPFTRERAAYELPRSNPFLRSIFSQLAGPEMDPSLVWAVDQLADLLNRTNATKILDHFAEGSGRSDPVFYFYEDFLSVYDPTLKELRGVYYTPEPVVHYIVRSVHAILQDIFQLELGLAENSKLETGDIKVLGNQHRVVILDPAAGTGTFLASVIEMIKSTEMEAGRLGAWSQYVREHLLPRIFGFELLMAPYTVCHLKLGVHLTNSGFKFNENERVGVYLTNSLEEPQALLETSPFLNALRREVDEAGRVKRDVPVMVILGNPPYSGHSANSGEFLRRLLRGFDTIFGEDTESYFHIDKVSIGERQPKWLNDDYVKFIRFSQWKIERSGSGLLAFITNHNYLSAPTFRAMRASLLNTFDDIYVFNLHGSAKRRDRAEDGSVDQNVFDIQQGVAIVIFVKRGDKLADGTKRVKYFSLRGPRASNLDAMPVGKYQWLDAHSVRNTDWLSIEPMAPYYLFVPRDKATEAEYKLSFSLKEIFVVSGVGIVAGRDHFHFAFTKHEMEERILDFMSMSEEEARSSFELGKDSTAWSVASARTDVETHGQIDKRVEPVIYRPFDRRFTYYTGRSKGFLARPTDNISRHMRRPGNIALLTARSVEVASGWNHVLAVTEMAQHHAVSTKEVNHLFPLWVSEEILGVLTQHHNLNPGVVAEFANRLGLQFEPEAIATPNVFGVSEVFDYVLAILHSDEFRQRYFEPLRDDYPRVPLTSNEKLFRKLVELGGEILNLHINFDKPKGGAHFPAVGSCVITRSEFIADSDARLWINEEQYFTGVDEEINAYSIGGIRIVGQWLSDRRRRTLSVREIDDFRGIIDTISHMIELPARIDECIDEHGGWPIM